MLVGVIGAEVDVTDPRPAKKQKGSEATAPSEPPPPPVRRQCYQLAVRGPAGDAALEWLAAPEELIAVFESIAPSVAVWPKTATCRVKDILHDVREQWQPIALSVLDELAAIEGGWIFSRPVDCKAWGCPDYYDVVEHPMDYSTIRKKFKNQVYRKCAEFVTDVRLVFSNCFRYNKPESPVASIGRNVERVFNELYETKGLQDWAKREAVVEDWYAEARRSKSTLFSVHPPGLRVKGDDAASSLPINSQVEHEVFR